MHCLRITSTAESDMKRKREEAPPRVTRDSSLPVLQKKDDIIRALAANDVLILVSETGSGKTTQVPQLILDANPSASVIITQPRRVAAMTVAMRVAAERGCHLGEEVGYAVRFEDKSNKRLTKIRYVTDGVFLREALSDGGKNLKNRYSHVIIDEVHERSINTDIALGIIKETLTSLSAASMAEKANTPNSPLPMGFRSQLVFKVVIMSATTDATKILTFLKEKTYLRVKIVQLSGRSHEVKTMCAVQPVPDYVDGAGTTALDVHINRSLPGDILVFLPGQDDIAAAVACFKQNAKTKLSKQDMKRVSLVSLYASQSPSDQMRAIQPLPEEIRSTDRKIIFATNIAETSITIPGVKYVVDSGMVKVRTLINHKGVYTDVLRVQPVSQAQAEQRKGRAGRTEAGFLFRLYTQEEFEKLEKYPVPEVLRMDAAASLLNIIALRHYGKQANENVAIPESKAPSWLHFPLIDKIPAASKKRGLETLIHLGALDRSLNLTLLGELMSRIPTSPSIARCLLEAMRIGCLDPMLSLAAVLSAEGEVFLRPSAKREEAKAAHRRFLNTSGDHLTLVNVMNAFMTLDGASRKASFCSDHLLNYRTLSSAESIRGQLNRIMDHGDMVSWALRHPLPAEVSVELEDSGVDDLIRRSLVAGFFRNVAYRRSEDGKYVPLGCISADQGGEIAADVHPTSVLRSRKTPKVPKLVLYFELVWTSKLYLRTVSSVERSWLFLHSNNQIRKKQSFS